MFLRVHVRVRSLLVAMAVTSQLGMASDTYTDLREERESLRGEAAGVIDTRLVVLAAQEGRRRAAPPRLPASEQELALTETSFLHRMDDGSVSIRITSADPEALVAPLEALGATYVKAVPSANLVDLFLPVDRIDDLADLIPAGMLSATAMAAPMAMAGIATSQADWIMEADRVRASVPGFDGSGVRIGTLSDSYNKLGGAAAGVASGDLPPDMEILEDLLTGNRSDEGRAMIELMHDLAPGAKHVFATAMISEASFAENIERLADPGIGNCRVIVDDILYFAEPYFQNSLVGRAINKVVNEHEVVFFSAAGNQGRNAFEMIDPETATDPDFPGLFIDFDPGPGVDTRHRYPLKAYRNLYLSLQWDDPFYTLDGVDTDIDVIVLKNGVPISTIATDNIANQKPQEIFMVSSGNSGGGIDIMLRVTKGPAPGRIKYVNYIPIPVAEEGEYMTFSPAILSHAAAERVAGVGAIDFFAQSDPRESSSMGPSTLLFDDNGERLPNGGIVRQTPLFAAIQNTDTTFFIAGRDPDGNGFPNFGGTSAAAPHAAAVAALVIERFPESTRDEVIERMIAGCDSSIGEPGYDNFTGHGSLNAYAAVFGPPVMGELPIEGSPSTGGLSEFWEKVSTNNGRVMVTDEFTPDAVSNYLAMDAHFTSEESLNQITLMLDMTGQSDVQLRFLTREYNDTDHPMPETFTGSSNSDGVAYSVDGGTTWRRIVSLTGEESTEIMTEKLYNLSSIAAANGDVLGSDVRVIFQQYGLHAIPQDGIVFADIEVKSSVTEVTYSFDVDSDGDGYSDGHEHESGSDLNDDTSLPDPLLGDINDDGAVDMADVSALAEAIVNSSTSAGSSVITNAPVSDINDDGILNVKDVSRLGDFVSGRVEILR